MVASYSSDNEFITKLKEITKANLDNPQFGVSWLAREMGMSRTNLHRKVKLIEKISVSQFINQIRLKNAKDILSHTSDTVSEVAYKVGYSNVSYFIKCFHDYYGYSPGQVGNRDEDTGELATAKLNKKQLTTMLIALASFVILVLILIAVFKPFSGRHGRPEKSIIVFPFNDDSPDEGNGYIINGLRRDIIGKLEKIVASLQ